MPRGPSHIASKGACIYCGDINAELSDEHIVPYSLGGSHVLRKASCDSCAEITAKFEQKVARDLWGDARTAFDAPSRRKSQRSQKLSMPDPGGLGRGVAVPAAEFPAGFVFYKMCQAGFLQGLPEDVDVSRKWELVVIDDDKRREEFLAKCPKRKLTLSFRHVPHDFGRLLAKIGYGQVLTQLDPGDFRPMCLPYILGQKDNVSYVVGGTLEDQAPEPDNGYSLTTVGFGNIDGGILVALIRLLSNTRAPAYHVVVGDVVGRERVERVMDKLGSIVSGVDSMQAAARGSQHHWLPRATPTT